MMRDRGADVKEAEAGCQSTSREEWGSGKFRGRGPGELRYQQLGGQGNSGSTMEALRENRNIFKPSRRGQCESPLQNGEHHTPSVFLHSFLQQNVFYKCILITLCTVYSPIFCGEGEDK